MCIHSLYVHLQTLGCRPVASLDHFVAENLGSADLVEEVQAGPNKIIKVSSEKNALTHTQTENATSYN